MQSKSGLYVITCSKKLAQYVITITEKSPIKYRQTFTDRLRNYRLDIIENIYLANETDVLSKEREMYQIKARKTLNLLNCMKN